MNKRRKFSQQIAMLSATLILVTVLLSAVALYSLNSLSKDATFLQTNVIAQLMSASKMKLSVVQVQQWLTDIAATRGAEGFDDGFGEAKKWAKTFRDESIGFKKMNKDNQKLIKLQNELDKTFEGFYLIGKQMAEVYIKDGPSEGNKFMEKFDPYAAKITKILDKQELAVNEPIKLEFTKISDKIVNTERYILILSILGIFAGVLVSFFLVRRIVALLSATTDTLSKEVLSNTKIASELVKSSQKLASSSTEQAAATQETSSALSEMSSMIHKTTELASNSKQKGADVEGKVSEGNQVMERLTSSMIDIKESNNFLQEIAQVIGEISQKTQVINDIVFKTQLLSFNASIEAARAGQHGKGFAVVAEEVGNLANMSGTAAEDIRSLIEDSQKKGKSDN